MAIGVSEWGDYENYRSNSPCTSGTGSFLDQQATRLNLNYDGTGKNISVNIRPYIKFPRRKRIAANRP